MFRDAAVLKLSKTFLKKITIQFSLYKATHPNRKFLFMNYIFWALLYRKVLCYGLAFPFFIIYFCIYPFVKFRFWRLMSSGIGHYSQNTEGLLAALDNYKKENDHFINLFYIEYSLFEPAICNEQLHKMWKRIIFIFPLQCSGILKALDKLIMCFLSKRGYGLKGQKILLEDRGIGCRDVTGYLKETKPHLTFTEEENRLANQILESLNIKSTDPYICLLVRSSAFNKGHPTWARPERNADLMTYMKACLYLADKGYYVLRMGKQVDDALPIEHPRIIDYARSKVRSDFMDIYLSAHCHFFMSTMSGLDSVAQIFRRPILITNHYMMSILTTWYPLYLFIPKLVVSNRTNNLMSFKEVFYRLSMDGKHANKGFDFFNIKHHLQEENVHLLNNSEEEILEAVIEMEQMVTGLWEETDEDRELQKKFWHLYPKNMVDYNTKMRLHGKINIRMGAKFLAKYHQLLN